MGGSTRDLQLKDWLTQRLSTGTEEQLPPEFLTLFGPPGSGKTSLLLHLKRRAKYTYTAYVDFKSLDDGALDPVGVLAHIVFQLSAEVEGDSPALSLPAYTALCLALKVADAKGLPADRQSAVRVMRTALDEGRTTQQAKELFSSVASGLTGQLAAHAQAAFSLLERAYRTAQRWQLTRQLTHRAGDYSGTVMPVDFLVGVAHGFAAGNVQQRDEARELLTRLLLADLRHAYSGTDRKSESRTLRCLVLLDNVDDERGQAFLRMLGTARPNGPEQADPLILMAAACSLPDAMNPLVFADRTGLTGGWSRWNEGEGRFTALRPQGSGFTRAAKLRGLNRVEVVEQCRSVVTSLPDVPDVTSQKRAAWLGGVVHDVTGGHPGETAELLQALPLFHDDVPVITRLREILAPEAQLAVVKRGHRRHFADLAPVVGSRLMRVAAAPAAGQALSADGLWRDGPPKVLFDVASLVSDELRMDSADFDGGTAAVLPPVSRRHLLYELAGSHPGGGPGTWVGTHRILRDAAGGRDAAYHQLALGEVAAATRYLDSLLQQVIRDDTGLDDWCRALSWIQRAPHPRVGTLADPREEYRSTVQRVGDRLTDDQMTIARLLIAGQLTRHPDADPYAALWTDPLWDPTVRLWGTIQERLLDLCRHLSSRNILLLEERINSYGKEPW